MIVDEEDVFKIEIPIVIEEVPISNVMDCNNDVKECDLYILESELDDNK